VHDLRQKAWIVGAKAFEDTVGLTATTQAVVGQAEVIVAVSVGEREDVKRVEVSLVLAVVSSGLGEAGGEGTQASAGNGGDQAIENLAILLVHVEALVEQVPEEPPALRHAKAVRPLDGDSILECQGVVLGGVVFQERNEIASGGKAKTLHDWPAGLAHQF